MSIQLTQNQLESELLNSPCLKYTNYSNCQKITFKGEELYFTIRVMKEYKYNKIVIYDKKTNKFNKVEDKNLDFILDIGKIFIFKNDENYLECF
mgnify:CR=1 FL=1